jgi:pyruvate/2-oxoacid:ferredoxin oxidoreductase beta subunit
LEEYLKLQGRFKGISEKDVKRMKEWINQKWKILEKFE